MSLKMKLVSALAMMFLMIGVLIVGIFAAQTQTITMEGSVNFEISDKTLYIQDVRVQMDNNNEPYSLKEQGEFLPGYINGNFNMNLGSLDNTYGSFAIYFDIVNLMVDGQTAVYNAEATTTQEGVTLEPSGEILGAELSADTATADELNNPANLSGTIKLLVTATSVPTVYLNQITLTINEAERLQSGFVFTPLTENTVELTYYWGGETDIVIPESYSVVESELTHFTVDDFSAIGNNMTYMASLIYGTWNYTDNNNNTGALNYFAMDGSVDLSSLAMPLQVDVDYIVNIPADNANSIEYFFMYLQMLVHMRDQYGMLNGGVYATFNGYERKLYTIEELNLFITTTFGDYNSDPSVLQNVLPATLELENPLKETIYYEGNTYTVTSLGYYCFDEHDMNSLTIPKTVTHIGSLVFAGTGCSSIYYQGNLEQWCEIEIEDLPLNYELYINGEKLVNAIIPEGTTSLLDMTFSACSSLTSVVLPSTLIAIGDSTFSGCSNLTNVDLSNCARLTRIGADAFSDCSISPNFTDDCGVNYFGNDTNPYMILLDDGTLADSSYIVPDTCITICGDAFYSNSSITDITLPSSLTSISGSAFSNSNNIETLEYKGAIEQWLEMSFGYDWITDTSHAFIINEEEVTNLVIPENITTIPQYAFYGCNGITSITLPSSLEAIGSYAFYRCSGFTSITLPSSLTSIGNSAFQYCSGLETLEYKGTTEQWLKMSFGHNWITGYSHAFIINEEEVTNLVIPENITTIPQYAFYGCNGITSITLPSSLEAIGSYAFYNCNGLETLDYKGTIEQWLSINFGVNWVSDDSHILIVNGEELTNLVVPKEVTSIGYNAFYGCSGLASITLLSNLTTIGSYAFENCTGITSVTINEYVFRNVTSSLSSCGYILNYIGSGETVLVPANLIDDLGLTNSYLDGSSFTRSETAVDGYYVYTKI